MHTGESDYSQIGVVKNWNYSPRTQFYPDHCGMVNGSAGEFYPPKQTKDKPISFYSPDMCRTLSLDFNEEVQVHGINGYKYVGGAKLWDNGTKYPDNKCFSQGEIVPSGVMNVSSCRFGTPAFMSLPHYYGADPYFLGQVDGLTPSKEKHEFYMVLEPTTGITLDVAARFQINMLVRPVNNIAMYQDAPYLFFPIIWFEQKVTIPKEIASEVQMVLSIPTTGYICIAVIVAIGLIMILWLPITRFVCSKKDMKTIDHNTNEKGITTIGGPESSPLMTKNGNLKNVELVKMTPKSSNENTEKKAPLAEREHE